MRVLVVGEDQEWAIEQSLADGLRSAGAEVELFDWWSAGAPRGRRELAKRPLWPIVAIRANQKLLEAADGWDVIFVIKGLLLGPETVEALRSQGRVVACFNPDNPWNRSVTSYSRTSELAMPAYDVFLTWSPFLISRLYSSGCRRVELLPFAWDPVLHPHVAVSEKDEQRPIVLVANHSDHRERWLRRLADLPITTFGPAWAKGVADFGATEVSAEPTVPTGHAYAQAVARAKVSLNIIDPHNCPGTNMRSFEVPGIGGVTLSTWTDDIAEFFGDGAVATFRTEEELRGELVSLLSTPDRRTTIRERSHAVAKQHTFGHRGRQLVALFGEHI
jgi:spore maturation protein CgeB